MKNIRFIYLLFALLSLQTAGAKSKYVAYLVAYMTGDDERHLYYALSDGDFHFRQLGNGPVLSASFDDQLIRDPHVLRCPDGKFRMVATVSWSHRPFTIWESDDLIHWQNERLIDVAPAGATKTWAPETLYDETTEQYIIYWTGELNEDWTTASIYYVITRDFQTFSDPAILFSIPGEGILDANIIRVDSTYHLLYRHNQQIWQVTATSALGPYTTPSIVCPENVEGPFAFPLIDGSGYGFVCDYYGRSSGFGLFTSIDFQSWLRITNARPPFYNEQVSFPHGIRHGSIFGITKKERKRLQRYFK